jgi:hypothetical protein
MLFDDIYGNSFEDTFRYAEHIRDVTAKDLQDLSESIFSQAPIISLVGPQRPQRFDSKGITSKVASVRDQSL